MKGNKSNTKLRKNSEGANSRKNELEASSLQNNDLLKYFKQSSNSEVKLNAQSEPKESKHEEVLIKDSQVLDKKEVEIIDPEVLFPTQLRSYYASAEF